MEKHNGDTGPQSKQHVQLNTSLSASSSPSHEFSFTLSLHPSKIPDKNTTTTPPFAIDLSPADEIFFHGHLLPLHLLSHLPVSPRSSINSSDSFTLPVKELLPENNNKNTTIPINDRQETSDFEFGKERVKSKSKFTPLFEKSKLRKGIEGDDEETRRRSKFDVIRVVKSYVRLMKPFISFRSRKERNYQLQGQTSSFSGNLLVKGKKELRGKRGGLSAPVSMRNSPTNSGHLVASENNFINSPVNKTDSTMEELQAAIQAAIAHCKKSIATKDQINSS